MFDTALSPAVTLPVIAALTAVLAYSAYDTRRRVRAVKTQAAKIILVLMEAAAKDANRRVGAAIEFTYDSLKNIGWDKLARGHVTFDDIVFGAMPKGVPGNKGFSLDELSEALRPHVSLDELKEALGGKPRYTGVKGDEHAHFVTLDDELVRKNIEGADDNAGGFDEATRTAEDAAGLEARPRHAAPDFSDRSPRAG